MVTLNAILPAIGLISATISNYNAFPYNPGFNIQNVSSLAQSLPSHSWEFGTEAEALLESYSPQFSVFGIAPFPVPSLAKNRINSLKYAAGKVDFGTGYSALSKGNGAAGDPASLGVAAVLLGKTDPKFATAAQQTVDGLLNDVPRFSNGAISHRADVAELWADFVYMVPPFLAYYAADKENATLLQEAVHQCQLYRQILQLNTTQPYKGLWMHIIGPESQDTGLWSTGNAWAAAGMTRVLATLMKVPFAQTLSWKTSAVNQLTQYIKEILDGAIASPAVNGLLRNYLNDVNNDGHGFGEISGSSLLASVAYRMAVLRPQTFGNKYITWADGVRKVLGGKDGNGNPHITTSGLVTPAVNPLAWQDTIPFTTGSPEGQVFVVLMYAAWRDCIAIGTCSGPLGSSGSGGSVSLVTISAPGSRRVIKRTHNGLRRQHTINHLVD